MSQYLHLHLKYLCAFIILLAIEVMIAVFATGPFIRGYIGDVLVVILIYCFIKSFFRTKTRRLPLYIFLFAGLVEGIQYFRLIEWLGLSDIAIIRIIAGATFDISDIACYLAGCVLLVLFEAAFFWLSSKRRAPDRLN